MLRGGNAKEIVGRVKEKVTEINERGLLPGGLQIVPFYDRTVMVDAALASVYRVLIEAMVFVILVMVILLGNLRVSLVVCATLVITPLVTFMIMNYLGIPANLMSLGGLTIAIGLMVDPTVVVVENIFLRLSHAHGTSEPKMRDDCQGSSRGGCAGNLWHYHHRPRVPAADVPAGYGRQDVQPPRGHHLHRAAGGAGRFRAAVAGAM